MFLVEREMQVFWADHWAKQTKLISKLLPRDVSVCGPDSFHFPKSLSRSSGRTSELIAMYADHLRGTTLEKHGTKHSTVYNSKITATTKAGNSKSIASQKQHQPHDQSWQEPLCKAYRKFLTDHDVNINSLAFITCPTIDVLSETW